MPTNKDFKRLVRARMAKTGESYTSARVRLMHPPRARAVTPAPQMVVPPIMAPATTDPKQYAKVAGYTDATIKAKTGCPWDRWVKALDKKQAYEWSHGDLATFIHDKYKVSGWWSQMVAVGYERIKGMRHRGQRLSGEFEATKSRVFSVPVSRLYGAFATPKQRAAWLPDNGFTLGKLTANKYWRAKWPDGTPVTVNFYAKGNAKSQLQVQHEKLSSKALAVELKAFWTERLDALKTMLER